MDVRGGVMEVRGGVMEVRGGVMEVRDRVMDMSERCEYTGTLEGRGRGTRRPSADTTRAASSPASGTVWKNDPRGKRSA